MESLCEAPLWISGLQIKKYPKEEAGGEPTAEQRAAHHRGLFLKPARCHPQRSQGSGRVPREQVDSVLCQNNDLLTISR